MRIPIWSFGMPARAPGHNWWALSLLVRKVLLTRPDVV